MPNSLQQQTTAETLPIQQQQIKNNAPSYDLDISGSLHATGNVQFDSDLNVNASTQLGGRLGGLSRWRIICS